LLPGIAVGEELLERCHQVLLVVSNKEVDQWGVEKARGFLIETLPAGGWRGARPDLVLCFVVAMFQAVAQSRRIFRNFRPNVVLGMGGFTSVGPLLWARLTGVPSCIHDSNAVPGKANRLAACFATRVAVGLEQVQKWFSAKKTVCTGTPVRSFLRTKGERGEARRFLGFSDQKATVLVMGGSQGARKLNELAVRAATLIDATEVQWLHLSGVKEEAHVRMAYARAGVRARVMSFYAEMDRLYAAADLVVARAGASSLAEIAQQSLPCILIPYPFAAENHQWENARVFAEAGAAVVREEQSCDPGWLAGEIQDILAHPARRKSMGESAQKLCRENAHRNLADLVEELGGKK